MSVYECVDDVKVLMTLAYHVGRVTGKRHRLQVDPEMLDSTKPKHLYELENYINALEAQISFTKAVIANYRQIRMPEALSDWFKFPETSLQTDLTIAETCLPLLKARATTIGPLE